MFYAYPLIQILIMALVMCAMIIIRLFWRTSSNTYYILSEFLLFSFMIIFLMIILILIYIIYMTLTLRLLLLLDIVDIYKYFVISRWRLFSLFTLWLWQFFGCSDNQVFLQIFILLYKNTMSCQAFECSINNYNNRIRRKARERERKKNSLKQFDCYLNILVRREKW